jgi:hypothetical protein
MGLSIALDTLLIPPSKQRKLKRKNPKMAQEPRLSRFELDHREVPREHIQTPH